MGIDVFHHEIHILFPVSLYGRYLHERHKRCTNEKLIRVRQYLIEFVANFRIRSSGFELIPSTLR